MKRWFFMLCMCLALSGCQAKSGGENTDKDTEAAATTVLSSEEKAEDGGVASAEDEEGKELPEESMEELVSFLEGFETELVFTDMEPEEAVSYGEPLKDFYEFRGRKTEDGFGYVLAVLKAEKDPLENSVIYGMDDYIVSDIWNEESQSYEEHFTFREISSLSRGGKNHILYLQPTDYVMPEELQCAFEFGYCQGEEGALHLRDLMERGVRFTPPDSGAYLSVERYVDSGYYLEYIPLSEEEEREILESNEPVDPVLYGNSGIQFFVSQDTYENQDIQDGAVTVPALEIAKERGKFQVVELSEIHDITKAEMKMREYDENTGMQLMEWAETETITDPKVLKTLETILSSSAPFYEGKCPYTGILTLTRKDGGQVKLYLATDSCDGFILGSHAVYSPGNEMTAQLWKLFPIMRKNTGWEDGFLSVPYAGT